MHVSCCTFVLLLANRTQRRFKAVPEHFCFILDRDLEWLGLKAYRVSQSLFTTCARRRAERSDGTFRWTQPENPYPQIWGVKIQKWLVLQCFLSPLSTFRGVKERSDGNCQFLLHNVLWWHVCRAKFARMIFFSSSAFLYEKCYEMFPDIFKPFICGSEKSRKIPAKFPAKFPCGKSKKIPTSLCISAERKSNKNCQFMPHNVGKCRNLLWPFFFSILLRRFHRKGAFFSR